MKALGSELTSVSSDGPRTTGWQEYRTGEPGLVIENLTQLATAGMMSVCAVCLSDYDRQLATAVIG
jgi:hypothetical protein